MHGDKQSESYKALPVDQAAGESQGKDWFEWYHCLMWFSQLTHGQHLTNSRITLGGLPGIELCLVPFSTVYSSCKHTNNTNLALGLSVTRTYGISSLVWTPCQVLVQQSSKQTALTTFAKDRVVFNSVLMRHKTPVRQIQQLEPTFLHQKQPAICRTMITRATLGFFLKAA